jgi:serine/threonine-protein kinase
LVLSPDNSLTIAGGVAISPDGRTVAFTARTSQSYNLYVRRLDDWEPHLVPLTEGAASPFFSPDGRWIAFLRKGLEKIALSGGSPQVICPLGGGGRWGDDNTIIFGRWPQTGLWQVPAAGGEPQAITKLSEGSNVRHMWPEPLPGGRGILFTLLQVGRTSIAVLPPGANQPRILVELGSFPRYLPSGHLVYVADKRLLAVPFDLERLEVSGSASVVINDVDDNPLRPAPYDVSASGTLVFQTAGATASNVVWKDRQGITMSVLAHSNQFEWPALSPDGKRFSVVIRERYSRNIWIGRVVDEPLTRLTFGNDDWYGVWSSDGKRLFYLAGQSGTYNIFWISADGGGKPERLTQSPHPQSGTSLSPNGDILLYDDIDPSTSADIWELSISSRKVRPVVQTEFVEGDARFSPDGHWISYRSDESGKQEVYVQAYPGPGIKKRISLDGGTKAFWSHTGRELFYSTATSLFAVPVLDAVDLRLGIPKRLFEFKKAGAYDISPDDQRFLMLEAATEMPVQVNLVQNWFEELKRLVPTGK